LVYSTGQAMAADRAKEYRHLAEDCLRLANLLPAGQRQHLVDMAQNWLRLAEEQERATDLRQADKKD